MVAPIFPNVPRISMVVYGLHAGDHRIRYVGATTQEIHRRLSGHLLDANRRPDLNVYRWLNAVGTGELQVDILEQCDSPEMLYEQEHYWIKEMRLRGYDLLNQTHGGLGVVGYEPSESLRRRWADMRTGRQVRQPTRKPVVVLDRSPSENHTEEQHKASMSNGRAGSPLSMGDANRIRSMYSVEKMTQVAIAEVFGISRTTVGKIIRNERWRNDCGV